MGSGSFKQPPEGPKIGPEKKQAELPEAKQQELGDLSRLVSTPAPLDPRVAAAEQPPEVLADLPAADEPGNTEDGVARLEALQSILEEAPEPEQDPAELAIEEAAEPTIEERQEFIRCMLGNKPYEKAFELFGGSVKLKMIDLTPSQTDLLFDQLARDQQCGVIQTIDDWNTELDRYRMYWMTSELTWGDETTQPHKAELKRPAGPPTHRETLNAFLARFKGTVPYRAMLHATRIFQRHLDKLVEGALDSDFWVAGGSDLPSAPISEEPLTTE